MVKDIVASKDGTITCDKKRGRPGEAPELTCRRCSQRVAMSETQVKAHKSQEAVDAHAKQKCSPPQVAWMHRPTAAALAAPELRGLVFVA